MTKYYGAGPDAVRALHDVSFEIGNNEFFTLLGPSGCGKTTLLRIIGGFEGYSQGKLELFNEEIQDLTRFITVVSGFDEYVKKLPILAKFRFPVNKGN